MSHFEKVGLIAIGILAVIVVSGLRLVAAKMAPDWLVRFMTPPAKR